jgi:hypothetical protein
MRIHIRLSEDIISLGLMLLACFAYVATCGWSVNYLLWTFLEKSLPFWGATLVGLFVGGVSLPLAIIVWVFSFLH